MKTYYSLSIPKPCHENWSEMTPNEKGRFCQSCSKTVVDFTKMNTDEVQVFIHNNKHKRICGHIKQNQLDTINLQISEVVFQKQMSFHKLFLLALLLTMGTTLFNCADEEGNTKRIESVEIVQKVLDSTPIEKTVKVDSTKASCTSSTKIDSSTLKANKEPPIIAPMGIIITRDTEEQKPPIAIDSISDLKIEEIEGEIAISGDIAFGMMVVSTQPEFKDTPKHLQGKEKDNYLKKSISEFISNNFNTNFENLHLSGKQKIFAQFIIDKKGNVNDIKVRAPHKWFEKEIKRVINLLPQFVPAKQNGKPVDMPYTVPIIFDIKD